MDHVVSSNTARKIQLTWQFQRHISMVIVNEHFLALLEETASFMSVLLICLKFVQYHCKTDPVFNFHKSRKQRQHSNSFSEDLTLPQHWASITKDWWQSCTATTNDFKTTKMFLNWNHQLTNDHQQKSPRRSNPIVAKYHQLTANHDSLIQSMCDTGCKSSCR